MQNRASTCLRQLSRIKEKTGNSGNINRRSIDMTNDSKEEIYAQAVRSGKQIPKALGLGLFSAASAIAGGLAVAWWYRKTLTKLQNPIASSDLLKPEFLEADPHGSISGQETKKPA